MAFKTDGGGLAFSCDDIKLQTGTWAMRLSQIAKQSGTLRIITYSLPDIDYVKALLGKRPHNIRLIAHRYFESKALDIKQCYPDIEIALGKSVHSKVALLAPKTVIISSANFGTSKWHETTMSLHSRQAHDWYVESVFSPLWRRCTTLERRTKEVEDDVFDVATNADETR